MLLLFAVGYVVVFLLIIGMSAVRYRIVSTRTVRELRWARWDPIAPCPDHEPMRARVDELVGEGYIVESFALLHLGPGRPRPSVVLGHPDGSVAQVSIVRGARKYVVPSITTCLVPGERWLETAAFPAVGEDAATLVEVTARDPAVPGLVARHRASRAWLADQGIGLVPIALGQAAREVESRLRASSEHGLPTFHELWINGLTRGGPLRKPLAQRPGIAKRLAEVRHRQAFPREIPRSGPGRWVSPSGADR